MIWVCLKMASLDPPVMAVPIGKMMNDFSLEISCNQHFLSIFPTSSQHFLRFFPGFPGDFPRFDPLRRRSKPPWMRLRRTWDWTATRRCRLFGSGGEWSVMVPSLYLSYPKFNYLVNCGIHIYIYVCMYIYIYGIRISYNNYGILQQNLEELRLMMACNCWFVDVSWCSWGIFCS